VQVLPLCEVEIFDETHFAFGDNELIELGFAGLHFAVAPADNLHRFDGRDGIGEFDRLETLPQCRVVTRHDGEIGMVIDPFDLGVRPFPPAVFLDAHECPVVQIFGRCQDFAVADHNAVFLNVSHPRDPRLLEVIIPAGDIQRDHGLFPWTPVVPFLAVGNQRRVQKQ
jgi:hypothetical protein